VAAATHGTTFTTARGTAVAVAHELAHTGAPATVMLATLGILLVLAGYLMVGLARRHDGGGARQLRMPPRVAAPPPRFA
jgi:xanthosine utilization system XapX-like protein